MQAEVVWLERAKAELASIGSYIAIHDEAAARRLIRRLIAKTDLLADHPRLGARRNDILLSIRIWPERPYLVFYRTVPDSDDGPVERVEIVSIVDGRRDLGNMF